MPERKKTAPPMAAARIPTTANRTGSWRFEKPVFAEGIAPCAEACPVGENIPAIMALHESGNFQEACLKILMENPFPGICGAVCFHPCERVCNRGRFDEAVSIRDLEAFAAAADRKDGYGAPSGAKDSTFRVAVWGSGLSGLSAAYFLRLFGHGVTILEDAAKPRVFQMGHDSPGLPAADLEWEVNRVLSLGIALQPNPLSCSDLLQGRAGEYDGVFLSADAQEETIRYLEEQADHARVDHITIPAGVRRSLGVGLCQGGKPVPKIVYPDFLSSRLTGSQASRKDGISKSAVREIAAGKLAAVILDLSLRGEASDSVRRFALGNLGAVSAEAYRMSREAAREARLPEQVVRYGNINPAHFEKSPRIPPGKSTKHFTVRQAVRSAARCFKCGLCTFCGKCDAFCPDLAVSVDAKKKQRSIAYDYCKGCGICYRECPRGAIAWVKEIQEAG